MKSIRKILACIRRADEQFNLIENGDRIAVGVSGGKDSLVLSYALSLYQKFSQKQFEMVPILLDLGFSKRDYSSLCQWFTSIGSSLIIEDAQEIGRILAIQKKDKEKLSCSICSRMKKASINAAAHRYHCNKVAFAHHGDDAIETLWMNAIFGARLATFSPKMYLEKTALCFIRPLILARETTISSCAKECDLPIISSGCPNDQHTMREEMKNGLNHLYQLHPEAKENFLTMLLNYQKRDLWEKTLSYPLHHDDLVVRPIITPDDFYQEMLIRQRVFIEEFSFSFNQEFSDSPSSYQSYLLYQKETPIGIIRYQEKEDRVIQISRFALLPAYRNRGYGSLLFSFIEKEIFQKYNPCTIVLSAMLERIPFYEKRGYQIKSEPFLEGNHPHILLEKKLN